MLPRTSQACRVPIPKDYGGFVREVMKNFELRHRVRICPMEAVFIDQDIGYMQLKLFERPNGLANDLEAWLDATPAGGQVLPPAQTSPLLRTHKSGNALNGKRGLLT